jgi:hypothetical protein
MTTATITYTDGRTLPGEYGGRSRGSAVLVNVRDRCRRAAQSIPRAGSRGHIVCYRIRRGVYGVGLVDITACRRGCVADRSSHMRDGRSRAWRCRDPITG